MTTMNKTGWGNLAPAEPVTRVRTVYGDLCHVATAHLADIRRTMLPLYTRAGIRWTDTPAGERAIKARQATTLHRENIATGETP